MIILFIIMLYREVFCGRVGVILRIERKHLMFRTWLKRLARKTICYFKSLEMHKTLFGLLINAIEFACKLF